MSTHVEASLRLAAEVHPAQGPAAAAEWGAALDLVSCAVAVLGAGAAILSANHQARALLAAGDGLCAADGCLRAMRPGDDADLRALLDRVQAGHGAAAMGLERPSGKRPYVLEATPAPGSGPGSAGEAPWTVVFVTDPERRRTVPESLMCEAHGLTAREAGVAARLAGGDTLAEAARALGITQGTARLHLDHALGKTGTHRQSDLLRLLLDTLPAAPPPDR